MAELSLSNKEPLSPVIQLGQESRQINLLPIIIAQQLVLLPLYFFIPLWIVVFNLCLSLLAYYFSVKKRAQFLPVLKWLITLLALAGIFYTFQRVTGRDAGVALITVMYGLKIIEIKSRRDAYVLMILGFFMLLAGFLFDQSPLIAIYQVIPILAILNALTSLHILPSNRGISEDVLIKDNPNIKTLAIYIGYALPLMFVLFVFFPRLSGPIWNMPGQSKGVSGISETMSPGAISSLQLFETVAFRVKFTGQVPNKEQMYWRTMSLDHFDGFTWSRSGSQSERRLPMTANRQLEGGGTPYQYDISLERTRQKWLTFLDRPSRWPKRATLYADYSAQVEHRIFKRTRYRAESLVGQKIDLNLSSLDKALYTELPQDTNKRSLVWAKEQRANYQDDETYIFALLRKIHNQEYYYTLTPPIMERDTVDSFWFDHKKGFCEHYAGSLVFMARAANIPARVVIGYQGGDANPIADYWIIRYADAHAWTEIWFEGKGWMRIDPTAAIAPSRVEEMLRLDYSQRESLFGDFGFDAEDLDNLGWMKHMQYWFDQFNTSWNDWILDYNRQSQESLFKSLGLDQWDQSQISVMMILVLSVILGLFSYRWMNQKKTLNPMEKSLQLLIAKIGRRGIRLEENEGIADFIRRYDSLCLQEKQPLAKQKAIQLLKEYQALSYQQNNLTKEQQKSFHKRVKSLKI